jgi:hypothetical protein
VDEQPLAAGGAVLVQATAVELHAAQPARHEPARQLGESLPARAAAQAHLQHGARQALLLGLEGALQVVQEDEKDVIDLIAAQEADAVGQPALWLRGNVPLWEQMVSKLDYRNRSGVTGFKRTVRPD